MQACRLSLKAGYGPPRGMLNKTLQREVEKGIQHDYFGCVIFLATVFGEFQQAANCPVDGLDVLFRGK